MSINNIILSEAQNNVVKMKSDELLVRGVAGSGKTLVILKKAMKLSKEFPNERIVIISYNKTLSSVIYSHIEAGMYKNIDVMTCHSYSYKGVGKISKKRLQTVNEKTKEYIIENFFKTNMVKREHRFANLNVFGKFISEEISWIKGMGIVSCDEYLKVSRVGRGTYRLSGSDRELIFEILEFYNKKLDYKYDFDDLAPFVEKYINVLPKEFYYDTVFIDEAQDLQLIQLRLLKKIAKKRFYVAADMGQKIYKTSFTWRDIGLNVTGGRTKILKDSFRSTMQIVKFAKTIQNHDSITKNEEFIPSTLPKSEGPPVRVIMCKDKESHNISITTLAKDYQKRFPDMSIGILAIDWNTIYSVKSSIKNASLSHELLKSGKGNLFTKGVKLTTFHTSKGLEFDHVIICNVTNDNRLVLDSNRTDELDLLRRLLYVSCTRAKVSLTLFQYRPYANILDEFDYTDCITEEVK